MSLFDLIMDFLSSLFGGVKRETVSTEEQPSTDAQTRTGYVDYTDMKEGVFHAMVGSNVANTEAIKRNLQQGCAKGQYPLTFTVGNWMYTITKLPDEKDHEMYGLQYKAEPYHQ